MKLCQFTAHVLPSMALIERISSMAPRNPFYTRAYLDAQAFGNTRSVAFCLRKGEEIVAGCTAFLRIGRLRRSLEIPSLPELPEPGAFWTGFEKFCADHLVGLVEINTFASTHAEIPAFPRERWRKDRFEYLLDLTVNDLTKGLSRNHKRNIKRGEKAGIELHEAVDRDACTAHVELMAASTERRTNTSRAALQEDIEHMYGVTRSGAGKLYQARLREQAVSSVLVLSAPDAGYYHSAGTNPAGMQNGASHYLVWSIANRLRDSGVGLFNLSGADADQTGLTRFKKGFGTTRRDLAAAAFEFKVNPFSRLRSVMSVPLWHRSAD